jgi:acyl dehydratase
MTGRDLGLRIARYEERDAILYALSVGASADDTDLVYEERLRVLPTFALTFGLWALEEVAVAGAYDRRDTLHVGQDLVVREPLPRRGEVETAASVEAVWDKGSAALVVVRVAAASFDARYTIYVKGAGGFGGPRGAGAGATPPARKPDVRTRAVTTRDQAALYRLTGDLHPLHIDPEAAREAGFERPILHGLGTLGCVAFALTRALGREPDGLHRLSARLAAPVYPGATIDISGWKHGPDIMFVASAGRTEALKGGTAGFRPVALN